MLIDNEVKMFSKNIMLFGIYGRDTCLHLGRPSMVVWLMALLYYLTPPARFHASTTLA